MLSKCVNPECNAPFHYLREGRLFRVDVGKKASPKAPAANSKKPVRSVEYFWLCGRCANHVTVKFDEADAPVVVPLKPAARTAVAS